MDPSKKDAPPAWGPDAAWRDHLAWCKGRALLYVECGDFAAAFSSMASDVAKHPAGAGHVGVPLGFAELAAGLWRTPADVRRWVEGFN